MNNAERIKHMIEHGANEVPRSTYSKRPKWTFAEFNNEETAVIYARQKGWLENKVQLKRWEDSNGNEKFIIEPYEEDCNCPGLIKPY
jgi:hypothetical protein